jgi:hypothetical protein
VAYKAKAKANGTLIGLAGPARKKMADGGYSNDSDMHARLSELLDGRTLRISVKPSLKLILLQLWLTKPKTTEVWLEQMH